jgi:SPP1 family predicted phage head-tail adaptor
VTIQRPVVTQDVSGQPVVSWLEHGRRWAAVTQLAGRELSYAKQALAQSTWRITLRYDEDILPTWRCIHEGRTMEIEACVDPDGGEKWLDLNCFEVVAT